VYRDVGAAVQNRSLYFDGEDAFGTDLIERDVHVTVSASLEWHQHRRHATLTQSTLDQRRLHQGQRRATGRQA
jgi:hypothetical protein